MAERAGVDAVFLGHIKGQWTYRGQGNIPYYIDGGVGGELYTDGPVGVDHGYWHGFRLIRVDGDRIQTDVVPIFEPGSIAISGPGHAGSRQDRPSARATGKQPFKISRKVDGSSCATRTRSRPGAAALLPVLGDFLTGGGYLFAPVALLAAVAGSRSGSRRRGGAWPVRRRPSLVVAVSGVALAQQSEPTSTPKESLPNPARIWTSSNPFVLAPERFEQRRPSPRPQHPDPGRHASGPSAPASRALSITSGFAENATRSRCPARPARSSGGSASGAGSRACGWPSRPR